MRGSTFLPATAVLCCLAVVSPAADWVVAKSPRFEIYSQAGPDRATETLRRFEELRSLFDGAGLVHAASGEEKKPAVRVIEFKSRKDYDAVNVSPVADAYYTGFSDRDYIVMPGSGPDIKVAAHEYAHYAIHSAGIKLPAWLNEGLAELFSTVGADYPFCKLGGPLPVHVQTLQRRAWLPVMELLASARNSRETRDRAAIFYAESWAVTDMLVFSPQYAPRFNDLVEMLSSADSDSRRALNSVYGKTPEAVLADTQDWLTHIASFRRKLSPLASGPFPIEVTQVTALDTQALIGDLLSAERQWDRAEQIYKEVLRQSPTNPQILASLGTVALGRGDRRAAIVYWRDAFTRGMNDAAFCYRYAGLADQLDSPAREIERALERAIAIKPDFDDARYKLALLNSNAGDYGGAVSQLQAMAKPANERAFGYWSALAYALSESGKRDEAESAARQAMHFAGSTEERARAAELAYVAQTDLVVRFARNSDGNLQLVTTRIPHGATDFNPFVEPADRIQIAIGQLREVQCSGGKLSGLVVESATGLLTLSIPDPLRVLVRNGPAEFSCGPQVGQRLKIEFAAVAASNSGLLRGMEFQ